MSTAICGKGRPDVAALMRATSYKPGNVEERDAIVHTCEPPDVSRRRRRHPAARAQHRFRARGLAGARRALHQRLSCRWRHRYAVAHSLPEDERTVGTIVRGGEQSW